MSVAMMFTSGCATLFPPLTIHQLLNAPLGDTLNVVNSYDYPVTIKAWNLPVEILAPKGDPYGRNSHTFTFDNQLGGESVELTAFGQGGTVTFTVNVTLQQNGSQSNGQYFHSNGPWRINLH